MWSKFTRCIAHPFKCVEQRLFRVPTLSELNDQKEADAVKELADAKHALNVAQYRIHHARAVIETTSHWRIISSGVPIQGKVTDPQPTAYEGNHRGT